MRLATRHKPWIKLGAVVISGLAALALGLAFVREPEPTPLVVTVVAPGIDAVFEGRDRLLAEDPDLGHDDALGRFPIPKDWARELFPQLLKGHRYDPLCLFTRKYGSSYRTRFPEHPSGGWQFRTNSLGLRGEEFLADPDQRILVTGDSHTEGACPLDERFTARLQAGLRERTQREVEVVNAAVGGFGFYNYLGVFEKFLYLEPELFVVVVYGGNDFLDSLLVRHFFAGTRRSRSDEAYKVAIERAMAVSEPAISQGFLQLFFLNRFPAERDVALEAAQDVTLAIEHACREAGVRLLVVYLPPLGDVQRARYEPVMSNVAEALELSREQLGLTDRLADDWMRAVTAAGVEVLDLRPTFRAANVDLYWHSEHHISTAGHALVAAELLRALEHGDD